ncbi:MAG: hypothetical protein AXW17_11420 [Colwellia sp. Phe_37]|nr:MAG: hypothetical protein AXW17_11420 [Colwellia sp. Phe_37]
MKRKILYACSGPANLVRTYDYWLQGTSDPNEVSITFSSQILDYCKKTNSPVYMISTSADKKLLVDNDVTIEHRKKTNISFLGGLGYHLSELIYGIGLLITALRFKADIVLADSGVTHYFILFLFRLFGIKVIPVLHNTLWPSGFPPKKLSQRCVDWLDKWFFIYGANAITGVSDECRIQVESLAGQKAVAKFFQFRAQFEEDFFSKIPAAPDIDKKPFTILFVGRVEEFKGVYDIVEMASKLDDAHPGKFHWMICGTGPCLENLRALVQEKKANEYVSLKGWVSLTELSKIYTQTHLAIVPTTSGFREGLAMTAAEAVLAGRPVITSAVVPAMNEMKNACYQAVTNDVDSYVKGINEIASDRTLYESLRASCQTESKQFIDRKKGLTAVLDNVIQFCFTK